MTLLSFAKVILTVLLSGLTWVAIAGVTFLLNLPNTAAVIEGALLLITIGFLFLTLLDLIWGISKKIKAKLKEDEG